MEKTIKMSYFCAINYQITSTSRDIVFLNNGLSRSLYLMELQIKMIKFAYFGEKPGKKHIFRSGSCQLIVVDLNLETNHLINVYPGWSTKN